VPGHRRRASFRKRPAVSDRSPLRVAGVDEVGRGCLAGPVVAAAVVLDAPIDGLRDSKQLSPRARARLANDIRQRALAWAVGSASVAEIDALNILQASLLAMRRAVAALPLVPDAVEVDGNQDPRFGLPTRCIVGGDGLRPAIMAASISGQTPSERSSSDRDRVVMRGLRQSKRMALSVEPSHCTAKQVASTAPI